MATVNDNLTQLYFGITSAQQGLGTMQQSVQDIALQIGDVQRQAAQINEDIGRAGVNMRDAMISRLLRLGVPPVKVVTLEGLQIQADSKGTYLRDEKNNFIVG